VAVAGYYMHDLGYKAAADIRDNRIAPVLATGTTLSNQWNDLVGGGAADRLTIQNIRSMLDDRGMWIDILGQVFNSMPPVPQGYPDPAYLKSNPRSSREMIVLNQITSQYYPDFAAFLAANPPPELGLAPPPTTPGAAPAAPATSTVIPAGSHGFVLTLNVTTPHENGFQYVLDALVPKLSSFDQAAMTKWNTDNPTAQRNFYIAKVSTPMQRMQIKDDSTRVSMLQTSYTDLQTLEGDKDKTGGSAPAPTYAPQPFRGGYGGFQPYGGRGGRYSNYPPPVFRPQPAPSDNGTTPAANEDFYLDRLTGEDRRNDWEMQVMIIVVIDPGPAVPAGAPTGPAGPVAGGP